MAAGVTSPCSAPSSCTAWRDTGDGSRVWPAVRYRSFTCREGNVPSSGAAPRARPLTQKPPRQSSSSCPLPPCLAGSSAPRCHYSTDIWWQLPQEEEPLLQKRPESRPWCPAWGLHLSLGPRPAGGGHAKAWRPQAGLEGATGGLGHWRAPSGEERGVRPGGAAAGRAFLCPMVGGSTILVGLPAF